MLHCTQPQNLFREQNNSLLWLVLSPYKISVCGCLSLMRLSENTQPYIFSMPLTENISGWKLNWRKGKMDSWAEHWLKTQRMSQYVGMVRWHNIEVSCSRERLLVYTTLYKGHSKDSVLDWLVTTQATEQLLPVCIHIRGWLSVAKPCSSYEAYRPSACCHKRALETPGNDMDSMASIKSCHTLWIWTCPMHTPSFVTQPPYKANCTSQRRCKALVSGICKALGSLSLGQL